MQSLLHFWFFHPALLYGIAFMLGIYVSLNGSLWLLIPCLSLWLPFIYTLIKSEFYRHDILKSLCLSLMIFFTAWFYTAAHYQFPILPADGITGIAQLKIKNISLQSHLFGERWIYRCEIQNFYPDHTAPAVFSSLPCLVIIREGKSVTAERPLANQEYWVSGKLVQTKSNTYHLKVSRKATWNPIPNSRSWAEQRYSWKKKVSEWIESQLTHSSSAAFLVGLATGEFDDLWIRENFARFGLQHILAISGFHFAIMVSFLSFLLRLFFSRTLCIISLLIGLMIYGFFLGPQASILRAWMMCSFALMGGLFEKQSTALNSLGLALLIILGYNPLISQELGFQLSFATTAAILIFYSPAKNWAYTLFPKRNLSEVLEMNGWNQHAYCVLAFFRQGLALTLAVNVFALPITLYYFHQFPWMSLLYNLFFPFLATGSMGLLLLGGLLSFVPFVPSLIHSLNDEYTFFLLQLTYQIPAEMDVYLKVESLPSSVIMTYLCVMSLLGIIWKERQNSSETFVFI